MENPAYTWGKYGIVTWGPMLVRTIGRFQPDDMRNDPPQDVDWVIGNACMLRRESLQAVGLFDEDFWQCNEDVDWCYRARAAGFRVVYVDRAAILHKGGSSADLTHKKVFSYGYFIGRNAFTFARKHGNVFQRLKLFITMTTGIIGRILFFTLDNAKHAALGQRAFVRGMLDGMRGKLSPEEITVQMPGPRTGHLRQGYRARVKRWLGV
jgi:GT2 family glycosyltransferase